MTEADWLMSDSPVQMLAFLGNKASHRKLRLFACACLRRIPHLNEEEGHLIEEGHFPLVLTIEKFADGSASLADVHAATAITGSDVFGIENANLVEICNEQNVTEAAGRFALVASEVQAAFAASVFSVEPRVWYAARTREEAERIRASEREIHPTQQVEWIAQAALIRHLFGNVFQPFSVTESWRATLIDLAQALYDSQDCSFALHDALLDAGYTELANHFRQGESHPKGCWVLDMILGKK